MRPVLAALAFPAFLLLSGAGSAPAQEAPPETCRIRVDLQMGDKDADMRTALEGRLLEALRTLPGAVLSPDGADLILDVSGLVIRVGRDVKGVAVSLVVKQPATERQDGVYRLHAHQLRLTDRDGLAAACAEIADFIRTGPMESIRKENRQRRDLKELLRKLEKEPEPGN